jgi:hypothetical protein
MASICSEDKPVQAHPSEAATVSCLLRRKHPKRKYKAKLEFLYILPIYRSVRQWSSKPGQASGKGKIEAGEKGGGMHMQQNVTCPEVSGTGHFINRFATHGTRSHCHWWWHVNPPLLTREQTSEYRMEIPNIFCQKEVQASIDILTVFWDSQGPVLEHCLDKDMTINSAIYSEVLHEKL